MTSETTTMERMCAMKIRQDSLWSDRLRHLGLPLSFTQYTMTEDRLLVSTGFLNIHEEEVLLYRVRDICLHLSLGQRLFGVGSVVLQSSDTTAPTLELRNIAHPRQVKEQISRQVELCKNSRRMRYSEYLNTDNNDDDPLEEDLFHRD